MLIFFNYSSIRLKYNSTAINIYKIPTIRYCSGSLEYKEQKDCRYSCAEGNRPYGGKDKVSRRKQCCREGGICREGRLQYSMWQVSLNRDLKEAQNAPRGCSGKSIPRSTSKYTRERWRHGGGGGDTEKLVDTEEEEETA